MARSVFALLGAALLCASACAQPSASLYLEELTWTELRDQIRAGKTTILVPIGGTEQNGPHMALGKHNARARILAGRIAERLGNALVAPVIAYAPEGRVDPPTQHMRFPGTISVSDEAFEKTLEGAARSFRQHGFQDIVFLGDHGGYQSNLKTVAARLEREWAGKSARAHAIEEYYRAAQVSGHAGADDTAITLALAPELVRKERLSAGAKILPADGVTDDPRAASVDQGQTSADRIVARTVDAIRKAVRR